MKMAIANFARQRKHTWSKFTSDIAYNE